MIILSKKYSTQTIRFSWPMLLFTMMMMTAQPLDTTSAWIELHSSTVLTTLISPFYTIVLQNSQSQFIHFQLTVLAIPPALNWCQSSFDVAVDMAEDVSFASFLDMTYVEILKMGLLLYWAANGCSNCQGSGGRCGYDNNEFVCFCRDRPHVKTCDDGNGIGWRTKIIIGVGATVVGVLLMICTFCCYYRTKLMTCTTKFWKTSDEVQVESFIRGFGLLQLKRYRFSDIKKMTLSFQEKLGQGGYGGVYKGKLLDGRLVAVKVLNTIKGNGEEFINEVASISRTSHVNIVTLLGFCVEGSKRALIYEFMPNGSLEKFIYNDNPLKTTPNLGWEKLLQIATGIARGLEYLHRGCSTRILHFDIKPHNILLDEDFWPKISDFGLSKLCMEEESIISTMAARGTIGYIAPEVFCRNFGGVSHKSDVYSYGMMILEMVGGRKNIKAGVSRTSAIYFPHWIYNQIERGRNLGLHGLVTTEEDEIARKMVLVGLWCIQTNPSDRPSMSKVIEMLQGSVELLQIPPKPFLSSPSSAEVPPSTTSTL
ncbi:hypothetical protein FNV43_RR21349 [Rhamnella rubrinervis]|uniref:Protein kinase domain-containing protein n=1 Tax=Rhamnella rubrinervis TaxID=2594499 RepID=A0A8K0E1I5_9ROSA|nr:hypothetical protein FNV43_RR21349 [Rhamnella rubrinervis]